jgi:protease-4
MKTKYAILLGIGVLVLILVLAFLAGYYLGFKPNASKTIGSDSWLVLDPSGEVADYNEVSSSGFFGSLLRPSAADICHRIRHAATDKRIKGILIKPGFAQISFANLNEIQLALQDFKAGGKPVIAHGTLLGQKSYLLCSMADQVYMEPSASAGLFLEGVSANILFYKNLLDKIGIKMHVMQSGEFKGAGEPYTRTSLNPGTEENIRAVLKGRYDLLVRDIARFRKLDQAKVLEVFENRPDFEMGAAQARQYGLIDEMMGFDALKEKYGITEDNQVSLKDYNVKQPLPGSGPQVAVINLSGVIAGGTGYGPDNMISSAKVDEIVRSIRKNKMVKAVVLRVNSPGGSALESELIYQKLKALGLPIVVSMGGVAASGGYYISCAGDYIFADPYTITGSIGVIMTLPEGTELGKKIGISSQTLGYGKFAGSYGMFEPVDPELIESLTRSSQNVYAEFKQRVSTARKFTSEQLDAVTEGRVFSAEDAKKNGLIDEVGSLDAAVKKAAELAKIGKYGLRQYPRKISFVEMLRKSGMFELAFQLFRDRDASLADRLEDQLRKTFSTWQWYYFYPWQVD